MRIISILRWPDPQCVINGKDWPQLNFSFAAIEEPFEPHAIGALQQIAAIFNVPMVLDESFLGPQVIEGVKTRAQRTRL